MDKNNIIATLVYLVFSLSVLFARPFGNNIDIILIILAVIALGAYRKYLKSKQ